MKKILFLICMMIGSVYADTSVPLTGNWNNVVTGTHPNNCCTGGPAPLYDPNTDTIHFSYGWTAVHRVIAINQALSGSGIQINGYNWGYDLRNMNGVAGGQGGTDEIYVTSFMTNSVGQFVLQSNQYFNTQFDWTRFTGTETLPSSLSLENAGSLGIQFVSRDSGFWAGYYGPQVRNVEMTVNYTAVPIDPCVSDPLSSPSCPGYASAYHDQQCAANPLYATTCSGYQQAYYSQQCSINPLYDSGCPGYQQAYYNQQCSLDALYDSGCPGYQQAYFNQQCSANPLYDTQCSGYAQAYFDQQCSLDGLYNRQCPNYATAYATQNLLSSSSSSTTAEIVSTTEPTVQLSDDGKVTTDVPLVSDPTVNSVLTKKTEPKKEESKEESKPAVAEKKTDSKPQAKREPPKVDPATQTASEKEFEKEIASQNQAISVISAVPGFSAYQNAIVPDLLGNQLQRQYSAPTVDNARAQRQLNAASDRLHNEMVQQQYR